MGPRSLPTMVSLPPSPEMITPYNCSEYYTIDDDSSGPLWIRALRIPGHYGARASKCLHILRDVVKTEWYRVQEHPHIARASFARVDSLPDPVTGKPTVVLVTPYYSRDNILNSSAHATKGQTNTWLSQICDAIQHLHANKVLHGNIHFRNMMIKDDGSACLTDAGVYNLIKRLLHDSPEIPDTVTCKTANSVEGNEEYAPPTKYDDLFALAGSIWTVYNRAEPWHRKDIAVKRIREYGHRSLHRPEDIKDGLWGLLQRIFSQDPSIAPTIDDIKRELLVDLD